MSTGMRNVRATPSGVGKGMGSGVAVGVGDGSAVGEGCGVGVAVAVPVGIAVGDGCGDSARAVGVELGSAGITTVASSGTPSATYPAG